MKIHRQLVVLEEIGSKDGEVHRCQQKSPTKTTTAKLQLHLFLPPTLNSLAAWALKSRTAGAVGRNVREDGESGSCVNQETPIRKNVSNMQQLAGGDGIQLPPAGAFPAQLQGCSHW
jgi:hypothetical protein